MPARARQPRRGDHGHAQVHRRAQARDHGPARVSRPGQRTYVDHAHIPRVQGGMGTAIISTSRGVMTGHEARSRASAARSWRRSGRPWSSDVPNRKTTNPGARGRDDRDRARARDRQRPQGRAVASASTATSRSSSVRTARRCSCHAPDRPRRAPGAARPHAHAGRQHGPGRHRRLREAPGDPGRRLPRPAARPRSRARARLLAPGLGRRLPTGSSSRSRSRRGSSSGARPSSRSARSPPTSASSASPSPTRARGFATRANTWPGRLVSEHDGQHCPGQRGSSAAAGSAPRCAAPRERPRISVFRSNRGIFAQLIDDDAGRTLASVNWTEAELRELGAMDQARRAGAAARRARQGGRRGARRVRPRRLPVPRARQGTRRRRPRGRAGISDRLTWICSWHDDRTVTATGPGPPGARG